MDKFLVPALLGAIGYLSKTIFVIVTEYKKQNTVRVSASDPRSTIIDATAFNNLIASIEALETHTRMQVDELIKLSQQIINGQQAIMMNQQQFATWQSVQTKTMDRQLEVLTQINSNLIRRGGE